MVRGMLPKQFHARYVGTDPRMEPREYYLHISGEAPLKIRFFGGTRQYGTLREFLADWTDIRVHNPYFGIGRMDGFFL